MRTTAYIWLQLLNRAGGDSSWCSSKLVSGVGMSVVFSCICVFVRQLRKVRGQKYVEIRNTLKYFGQNDISRCLNIFPNCNVLRSCPEDVNPDPQIYTDERLRCQYTLTSYASVYLGRRRYPVNLRERGFIVFDAKKFWRTGAYCTEAYDTIKRSPTLR